MTDEQKRGRRIILKDGTTFEDSGCGYADGFLWCYITGLTLQDVVQTMMNPEKTVKIVYEYGEMSDTYEGFTNMFLIRQSETGCDVCMQQA